MIDYKKHNNMAWQKHNHAFKIQCHSKLGNEKVEDGLGSWIMNELLNISYTQNECNLQKLSIETYSISHTKQYCCIELHYIKLFFFEIPNV